MFSEQVRRGVYFIGVGGVSMSALAMLLHGRGIPVRGSDAHENNFTVGLRKAGIPVAIGEDDKIFEETVVYTGAVAEDHPQLTAARRAGKRLVPRAKFLGELAEEYPHVLSVAGCHGKTTASCMLSHVLAAGGLPFTSHIGGEDLDFGNIHCAGGEYFVTEACEFRRSFLELKSEIAVILNCDRDHSDCYKNDAEVLDAYRAFAARAERTVVNADDARARSIPHDLDFGLYSGYIRAERIRSQDEKYAFTVTEGGTPIVRVYLGVFGKVHIYNALAAYAAARLAGLSGETIKRGLEGFRGVKRRFERVGTLCGVPVICDYAHHPREIAAAISTADRLASGTVRLVFQPHTFTRTRDFLEDFVDVLGRTESPILYKTYSAREPFLFEGSAVMLASKLPDSRYVQSAEGLKKRLCEVLCQRDLILILGAGDIYDIARSILDPLP